jgi:hypothetical protein
MRKAALGIALAALLGCGSVAKEQSQVIEEGVLLLEGHAHPELPLWEARRAQFLEDAKPFLPTPAPSPAGVK